MSQFEADPEPLVRGLSRFVWALLLALLFIPVLWLAMTICPGVNADQLAIGSALISLVISRKLARSFMLWLRKKFI
jgi:hypothetical protein